jgi:CheY-like chemotaxis protein
MSKTILIVDDEKNMQYSLEKLLGNADCKIITASDGKEAVKKVKKEYIKKIRVTQEFKINKYFRKKINEKLKMKDKYLDYYSPTVGCTNRQLKKYIESQFTKEMSWDNYGKIWNVDHIIPIVAFLENIKEERKYINHYLNLQPLLIYNNSKKGKFYKEEDKVALVEKIKNLQNN